MRRSLLVLAVVLTVGATHARADQIVSYNMSGTITSVQGSPNSSYAVGDHISWTLQYDRSTPLMNSNEYYSGYQNYYVTKYPVITNIVDHTNGYHFPWPSGGGSLLLFGDSTKYPSSLSAGAGNANLFLVYKESFPTSNLSDWQLNSIPLNLPKSDFSYYVQWADPMPGDWGYSFNASVDSISGPMAGTLPSPEPGSLTLFLFGAAGLATRRIRRRCPR